MSQPVIMWFRQDLRLSDHPALAAAAAAGSVIPVFILDDHTPGEWRWGGASRWWLHRSLEALATHVPLVILRGEAVHMLQELSVATKASAIYFTRDYAPWSGTLEERVKSMCDQQGLVCKRYGGFLLHEPESIRNGSGAYFKVYTPFSRACFAKGEPRATTGKVNATWAMHQAPSLALNELRLLPQKPNWAEGLEGEWSPGETGAQQRLAEFLDVGLAEYADGRDIPGKAFTSKLSAHLHWGEISPHQVWHATRQRMNAANGVHDRAGEKFLKEVLWREFSHCLLHHNPRLPERPFKPEYEDFPWLENHAALHAWQRGRTGYPIVDAGMRELWTTGIMHNRVRMIVASFLVKHLLINWQEGERWFWDTLVDADIANNAASWQWVAGCGADAAPYFRIFNPVLQGEKFDAEGTYVRRWVPELADVPSEFIHQPWTMPLPPRDYPRPIIDHGLARERALAALKEIKKGGE